MHSVMASLSTVVVDDTQYSIEVDDTSKVSMHTESGASQYFVDQHRKPWGTYEKKKQPFGGGLI